MQSVIPGQANTIAHDLVQKANGAPITAGTVTFYLIALNGASAGKWFKAADETWSATEVAAGTGTFKGGSTWLCEIAAAAWSYGVEYLAYAKESADLQVDYSEQIIPSLASGAIGTGSKKVDYTVTDSVTKLPVADVTVWVCTDSGGVNVIAQTTTNAFGVATFYLAPGTYYVFCSKSGYSFQNPDTEVVS